MEARAMVWPRTSLLLKITEEEHSQIKAMAALSKQSMKAFVLNRIFSNTKSKPNKETLEAFKELEETRDSLKRYNSFSDLLKDENIDNA